MKIKLELNRHDKWIGAYDEVKQSIHSPEHQVSMTYEQHIWICIIPCVPIHIWWGIKERNRS